MYIESGPEFYRNANSRGVSTICEKESRTRWTERTMNETGERERGNGTNYPRRRMEREKKAKGGIYKVEERWINNEKERKRERGIKKEASVMLEM